MPTIPFTQYLRPNGRAVSVSINRPQSVYDKAKLIMDAGFGFSVEELSTGHASFTIGDDYGDYSHEVCFNGPEVPKTVDTLINEFDIDDGRKMSELARNAT